MNEIMARFRELARDLRREGFEIDELGFSWPLDAELPELRVVGCPTENDDDPEITGA